MSRRPPGLKAVPAILIAWLVLNSCGMLNYGGPGDPGPAPPFPARTYSAEERRLILSNLEQDPEAAAALILNDLRRSPDPVADDLGRALLRLPDLNDGRSAAEAKALLFLSELAASADEQERERLAALAAENPGPRQYGGALQGLFWLVQKKALPREAFATLAPETYLRFAWSELENRLTTPEKIMEFLAGNFAYVVDLEEVQSQQVFFADKYGDCSEFSSFAGLFLGKLGFEVQVLITRPTFFSGHISIVYRDQEGWKLLDASRFTLARALKEKAAGGRLGPVDLAVWFEVKDFDRIHGPEARPEDLVRVYDRAGGGGATPYRFVDYEEYERFTEKNGRDNPEWLRF